MARILRQPDGQSSMNVLICTESHYVQVGDEVYCPLLSPDYFQRYREIWDEIVVLGRSRVASRVPQGAPRLELDGLRLVALPDYTGPLQYLQCRGRIRSIVREVLPTVDSIIMRGGHQISQVVYSFLRGTGRPYGVEVVGDPYNSLARGATPSPLWTMLRGRFVRDFAADVPRRICLGLRHGRSAATSLSAEARHVYDPLFRCRHQPGGCAAGIVSNARSVPTNRHRHVGHKIQGS